MNHDAQVNRYMGVNRHMAPGSRKLALVRCHMGVPYACN